MKSIPKAYLTIIALNLISTFVTTELWGDENYPSQIVKLLSENENVVNSGESFQIYAIYNVSNGKKLTGIGIRIHYNSNYFELLNIDSYHEYGQQGSTDSLDENDYDNDSNTDRFFVMAWTNLGNTWPLGPLPSELLRLTFKAKDNIKNTESWINISASSTTGGYLFEGYNFQLHIKESSNLDINKDGKFNLIDVIQSLIKISMINY